MGTDNYQRLKFEYFLKNGMQGSLWAYYAVRDLYPRRAYKLVNPWEAGSA